MHFRRLCPREYREIRLADIGVTLRGGVFIYDLSVKTKITTRSGRSNHIRRIVTRDSVTLHYPCLGLDLL
jgi:hypothetical protein